MTVLQALCNEVLVCCIDLSNGVYDPALGFRLTRGWWRAAVYLYYRAIIRTVSFIVLVSIIDEARLRAMTVTRSLSSLSATSEMLNHIVSLFSRRFDLLLFVGNARTPNSTAHVSDFKLPANHSGFKATSARQCSLSSSMSKTRNRQLCFKD